MEKFKCKKQSVYVPEEYVAEFGTDGAYVLAKFNDRMKSSINRKGQFKDENGFYIIFTIDEIMKMINRSKSVVNRIINQFKNSGYVITTQPDGFNRANHIYLPKFSEMYENVDIKHSIKNDQSKVHKNYPNQLDLNQFKTNDTNHTKTTENQEKTVKNQKQVEVQQDVINLNDHVEAWKYSVTKAHINSYAVDSIIRYCRENGRYNLAKCQAIVGNIFKAKNIVATANGLDNNDKRTRFENNTNLNDIKAVLDNIFIHARTAKNDMGYIFASLKRFFTNAMGFEEKNERVTPTIINNRRGHHDVKIPDWMKKEYDPEKDKVTDEEKAEARAALERIRQMTIANNK